MTIGVHDAIFLPYMKATKPTAPNSREPSSADGFENTWRYVGIGAGSRNRTHDQRFTKPLLYQLSYAGA